MDKAQKTSNLNYNTPSSYTFRIDFKIMFVELNSLNENLHEKLCLLSVKYICVEWYTYAIH